MSIPITVAYMVATAVFAAGGAWWLLKSIRRDVNGLGAKFGRLEREHIVLLMLFCPEDKKQWLAEILLRK